MSTGPNYDAMTDREQRALMGDETHMTAGLLQAMFKRAHEPKADAAIVAGRLARLTRGLADAFGAVSVEQVEFIEGQAERILEDASVLMPRDMDGMTLTARMRIGEPSSISLERSTLAAAQVLARELHATTEAQLAWVAFSAECLWAQVMTEMPHAFGEWAEMAEASL